MFIFGYKNIVVEEILCFKDRDDLFLKDKLVWYVFVSCFWLFVM